ncbi:MAG: sel1 repeat family protein [Deltaproteobacteria bacterium]|jgi:TPR repeat protein|nr:sel1 repeat family protein [Deltaproteobacteria bacterium]
MKSKIVQQTITLPNQDLVLLVPHCYEIKNKSELLFNIYKKLAELGDPHFQYEYGCCFLYGRDVPQNTNTARKWFQLSAEQGYARSQYKMGIMHIRGEGGVNQDLKMAANWFQKAAEQNVPAAHANLASFYARGGVVPKDRGLALKWFHRAAEQGNALAQFNLGRSYLHGGLGPKNVDLGVHWLKKAAEQGFEMAIEQLRVLNIN